jgi:hypothetical protein
LTDAFVSSQNISAFVWFPNGVLPTSDSREEWHLSKSFTRTHEYRPSDQYPPFSEESTTISMTSILAFKIVALTEAKSKRSGGNRAIPMAFQSRMSM